MSLFETGLFSVLFISCGRPKIARICLEHTYGALKDSKQATEWIMFDQSDDRANKIDNIELFDSCGLCVDRSVFISAGRNRGISYALNQSYYASRGEFIFIHEDDWLLHRPCDFLSIANDIFSEFPEVGIISLRDPYDPFENWGRRKSEYAPWSCTTEQNEKFGIIASRCSTKAGHIFYIANHPYCYNNNPNIVRRSVLDTNMPFEESTENLRGGESEMQVKIKVPTAYIGIPLYRHIGGALARNFEQ